DERIEQDEQTLPAEELEPGDAITVIAAVVVALDGDGRNTGFFEPLQTVLGLDEREGVDGALVEEVAGDDDEIGLACDGVVDDGVEGEGEVVEARLEAVLLVAEVIVGRVDEGGAHGRLLLDDRGLSSRYSVRVLKKRNSLLVRRSLCIGDQVV